MDYLCPTWLKLKITRESLNLLKIRRLERWLQILRLHAKIKQVEQGSDFIILTDSDSNLQLLIRVKNYQDWPERSWRLVAWMWPPGRLRMVLRLDHGCPDSMEAPTTTAMTFLMNGRSPWRIWVTRKWQDTRDSFLMPNQDIYSLYFQVGWQIITEAKRLQIWTTTGYNNEVKRGLAMEHEGIHRSSHSEH